MNRHFLTLISPDTFSIAFVCLLLAMLVVRLWLGARHIQHVTTHRDAVPPQFAASISLEAHRKAADYSVAKARMARVAVLLNAIVLIGFTLLGGLQYLSNVVLTVTGAGMLHQIGLIAAFTIVSTLIDLPLEVYQHFVLEARFGFNKMTPRLFVVDTIKSAALGSIIGLPVAWIVLTLMGKAGTGWWLYAWGFFCVFQAVMLALYPTVIAPLFNKFYPLEDEGLKARIEALMQRTGFAAKGLFVMDGSTRSAHGNAYFSGFGAAKRIVFFDTLLARLSPPEIEAVLAHELGHFKRRHITKRMLLIFALSLGLLALLGFLKTQGWFYAGLGVNPATGSTDAMALLLFLLTLPLVTFFLSPLMALGSRKHEYEADAYAAHNTSPQDLVSALVKMYEDNAATLTPDPLYSAFYDSHPPASLRVGKLLQAESGVTV